jgi:membrane fusion protein, multidrug efflux system
MNRRKKGMKIGMGLLAGMALALTAMATGCGASKTAAVTTTKSDVKISVSTTHPQKKSVQGELVLNGTIHAENEVQVVSETQGKVTQVFVQVGSHVAKGDILAQIDDDLKKAALDSAQAAFDKSKADWDRAQDLYAQKVISDQDRQGLKLQFANTSSQLKNAKRDLENTKVTAPQDGVVTQKSVSVGSMLSPGAPVAYLVDTANLKLTVQIGEKEILKIKEGMKVSIDSDLYPGVRFSGTVSGISPKGDSALTFPVEIALKSDPRKPLYDGMSAKAHINLGQRMILAIPRVSLVGSYQKPQVYLVENGVAKLVSIVAGGEYGTDFEALDGLSPNDDVVTDGQNNLFDGALVSIVKAAQ